MGSGFKAPTNNEINDTSDRSNDEKDTNIADATLNVLCDVAEANEMVIILRPVNSTAFAHMKAGAVGKNMFVHGKSANQGTIAQGLIPLRSSISKAGAEDDVSKINTYNAENEHSIETSERRFKEIEDKLKEVIKDREEQGLDPLSSEELLEAAKIPLEAFDPLVATVDLLDKNGNQLYIFEDDKGRAARLEDGSYAYAIKNGDEFQLIDLNHEPIAGRYEIPAGFKEQAVEVLGKPDVNISEKGEIIVERVRPITADIDVLAYGTQINLHEFDNIVSYRSVLKEEKGKVIEAAASLSLPDDIKKLLTTTEIDKALDDPRITNFNVPDSEQAAFKGLISDLRDVEFRRENLRGMGEGADATTSLTGFMRAEFKDKIEISHGAEQFNTYFTQPMDKEWIVIDSDRNVTVVKGEENLIKTFNKFKNQDPPLSMPPNPNWGWKVEDGEYKIDNELRAMHNKAGDLTMKLKEASAVQREAIYEILELKTKLGVAAITESPDANHQQVISGMKTELNSKIEVYNKQYAEAPQTTKLQGNIKLSEQELGKNGVNTEASEKKGMISKDLMSKIAGIRNQLENKNLINESEKEITIIRVKNEKEHDRSR